MKKIFKIMTLALVGVFALASCGDDVPAPNPNPNPGGGDEPSTEVVEITCAQAVELCAALADNASSTETYAITGYITDVFAEVSKGQQSFWLSDNNDGQKMVQAYWANLPEGVEKFVAGSKVKITGKLIKYVKKDGTIITEVKNADVEILEAGGETPDTPDTPSEDNTFAGADATVVMSEAYSECTDGSVDATPITFDAVQVSFDKNGGNNAPKYFWNGNAVRMYAMNTMTITSDKQIAKIVIKCTAPDSKNYNGNDEMTTTAGTIQKADDNVMIVVDGINQSEVTITNQFTAISGGTQLRILSMGVYYVK